MHNALDAWTYDGFLQATAIRAFLDVVLGALAEMNNRIKVASYPVMTTLSRPTISFSWTERSSPYFLFFFRLTWTRIARGENGCDCLWKTCRFFPVAKMDPAMVMFRTSQQPARVPEVTAAASNKDKTRGRAIPASSRSRWIHTTLPAMNQIDPSAQLTDQGHCGNMCLTMSKKVPRTRST